MVMFANITFSRYKVEFQGNSVHVFMALCVFVFTLLCTHCNCRFTWSAEL